MFHDLSKKNVATSNIICSYMVFSFVKKNIILFIEYYWCVSLRFILLILLHEEHMFILIG